MFVSHCTDPRNVSGSSERGNKETYASARLYSSHAPGGIDSSSVGAMASSSRLPAARHTGGALQTRPISMIEVCLDTVCAAVLETNILAGLDAVEPAYALKCDVR